MAVQGKYINEKAFNCLDEAMFLSSLVSDQERAKGEVNWEHVYPTTREETEQMEEWLKRAKASVQNPGDPNYIDRFNKLSEIVEWSKKRHRSWLWQLIAGALLGAGIFYYFENDQQDAIKRAQADVAAVEKWDSTEVGLHIKKIDAEYHHSHYGDHLQSAKNFKMYEMSYNQSQIDYSKKMSQEYKTKADTTTNEDNKETYLDYVEMYEKRVAEAGVMLDSLKDMNFAEVKAYALAKERHSLEKEQYHGDNLRNFMIYLLILIPLYIISGYPRGYTLTRHRRMSGCLTSFRKIGFGIAAFFFGTGLLMSLLPDDIVKYRYSDGHTETRREGNSSNLIILFLKITLIVIGAFIFCFVSAFIMTIETVLGLIRNFDWGKLLSSKIRLS